MRSSLFRLALVAGCFWACDDDSEAPDLGVTDSGPALTCPPYLRFTFLAQNRSDVGWTGNTHRSTFPEGAFFRVRLECDEDCVNCAFTGPIRDEEVITQRCVSDPAVTCAQDSDCPPWECRDILAGTSTVGGEPPTPVYRCADNSDQQCQPANNNCAPGACRFFVGPPFPLLAPATCLGTYFDAQDEDQTLDPVRGQINLETGQLSNVTIGIVSAATDSAVQGACPVCLGDGTPNDGVREGTCQQNPVQPAFPYTANQSCDANGTGQPDVFANPYSLDCSTPLGIRIQVGMENGSTLGSRFTLSDEQPDCGGQPCWCGVCQGTLRACHSSSECEGDCVAPEDIEIRPNGCVDRCDWDPGSQTGTCMTDLPPAPRRVPCFPEGMGAEIVARGESRILENERGRSYSVRIGHVECRQPVQAVFPSPVSVVTDSQVGLPGPQLNIFNFQIDPEFEP